MNLHRPLSELAGLEALPPRRRDRVRRHLADCQRCRDDLTFVRSFRDLAAEVTAPAAPAHGLARVLARREAGERVILPADVPPARPRRRVAVPLAIAVTAVAAVAITAQLAVRAVRLHQPESAAAPAPAQAAPSVGIAIVPTGDTAEVRLSGPGLFRLEALIHDGRELGVRGRGAAEAARFRTARGGISVSEVTGGEIEVRIPRGISSRIYVNDRLVLTGDGRVLRVERDGAVRDRVVLDVGR